MRRALTALVFIVCCAVLGIAIGLYVNQDPELKEELESRGLYFKVPIPKIPVGARTASKVIYLNREGVELTWGVDESSKNRTSLVPREKGRSLIPAFTGSNKTWNAYVKCVRSKFTAFDVEVVDRRPLESGYLMVATGGTTKNLGRKDSHHATGLAPFSSEPIPNAVVVVFSSALRNNARAMCETAGMEIAHAYGLDHARHCSDLMTYMRRCGTRKFLDKDLRCGEHKDRDCANGDKTQNSYQHLLKVLGPRPKNPAQRS